MARRRTDPRRRVDCAHNKKWPHGTLHGYNDDGCRCHPCTDAYTAYDSNRTKQIAYGRWADVIDLVDNTATKEHVARLRAAGWTVREIADGAGVAYNVLQRLLWPPLNKRIRRDNEAAILALVPVAPTRIEEVAVELAMDGHYDRRLTNEERREVVRRLHRRGYSDKAIERQTGIDERQVLRDRRTLKLRANYQPVDERGDRNGTARPTQRSA